MTGEFSASRRVEGMPIERVSPMWSAEIFTFQDSVQTEMADDRKLLDDLFGCR